jgi:MOSC domain-containing protein YiiM
MTARLLSIQVGLPATHHAAVGIHGGPDKAVLGYSASRCPLLRTERKLLAEAAAEVGALPVLSASWRRGLASA